ncbi:hypothetical protein CUMW_021320 [Citrus unshiu]|nr:hypothetical protein CUMW_021320 [Citrus unshiu]
MESRKVAFTEQLLSPRRKVVSGFGLGVAATVIVFVVLLLSNSLKAPAVSPLFQGFNLVRVINNNSSRVVSWPFSFTTAVSNDTGVSVSGGRPADSSVDLVGKSQGANVSNEIAHLGNLTQEAEVGSILEANASAVSRNGNFSDSSADKVNFSHTVNNGSFPVEEGRSCGNCSLVVKGDVNSKEIGSQFVNNTSYVNSKVPDNNNVTNLSGDDYLGGEEHELGSTSVCLKLCIYLVKILLNATDFLERLRGKKLVFVGDSLNRNMWESLVCILRNSIRNKKRVYEISGRREFKKKGFYAFIFEASFRRDYNCTVDFVSSPFLVRESSFTGRNGTFETLRLDLMDRTTSMYQDADVIIFNTGHWWTHEKTSRGEDYYQEGNFVHPRLKVLEAYQRALTTWARWVDKNVDHNRTKVFFRGYSVTHFKGGQWNSGGQCHKETEPIFNVTYLAKYPSKMRALEYMLPEMKTPVVYLNISRLTDFRKDGHPSIYRMEYKNDQERIAAVNAQDCSHWCLPGVPDTWNELLYVSLLKTGRESWKS